MPVRPWTESLERRLSKMRGHRRTYADMALALGVSRSVVCEQINLLGDEPDLHADPKIKIPLPPRGWTP